jgi:hypothetical protein
MKLLQLILAALILTALPVLPAPAQTITPRNTWTDIAQTATPTSGSTVTLVRPAGPALVHFFLTLTPAAAINSLTIATSGTLQNGDMVTVNSSQFIRTLTFSGSTFSGAPINIAANSSFTYQYVSASSAWKSLAAKPGQTGLENSMATPLGTSAPIVIPFAGAGDEQAILNAKAQTSAGKRGLIVGDGGQMNNQVKLNFDEYLAMFAFTGGNMDGTTMGSAAPRLTINTSGIAANAPFKAAYDMNGATEMSWNGFNVKGDDGTVPMALVSNSQQNGGCCAKNAFQSFNQSLSNIYTFTGCPIDRATMQCASGTTGAANYLPRFVMDQFSNFMYAITANASDVFVFLSQISGGGGFITPVFGGGAIQVALSRLEFAFSGSPGIWLGGVSTGGGDNSGSFFTDLLFDNNFEVEFVGGKGDGYLMDGNVYNRVAIGSNSIMNGTFDTDFQWSKGTGVTISGGAANFTASSGAVCQYLHVLRGYTYTLGYTVNVTSGSVRPSLGGTNGTAQSTPGTLTVSGEDIIGGTGTMQICFTGTSFTGTIDAVTIKPKNLRPVNVAGGGNAAQEFFHGSDQIITHSSDEVDYPLHLNGTGTTDYVTAEYDVKSTNLQGCVNMSNETPAHMKMDCLLKGATDKSVFVRRGYSKAGFGPADPRTTVVLDLKDATTASKPLGLPVGTTAQRPTCDAAMAGGLRQNSDTGLTEVCLGNATWAALAPMGAPYDGGNCSGGTYTVNLANGIDHALGLAAACTITPPTVTAGGRFSIEIGVGSSPYSWSISGVRWPNSAAPTPSSTANDNEVVGCRANRTATAWNCAVQPAFAQ